MTFETIKAKMKQINKVEDFFISKFDSINLCDALGTKKVANTKGRG